MLFKAGLDYVEAYCVGRRLRHRMHRMLNSAIARGRALGAVYAE